MTILARFFGKLLGQDIDPLTNVMVTVGAYEALFCCFQALVDSGDEVTEDSGYTTTALASAFSPASAQ